MKPSPTKAWLLAGVVLCLAALGAAQSKSQSDDLLHEKPSQYVTQLPMATVPVTAGKVNKAKLHFKVKPGFHINSNTPRSELLIPTTLHLSPPTEIGTGGTKYQPGVDLAFPFDPKQKLSVYSGEFVITTNVAATPHAPTGLQTVHGTLHYQACNDNSCFPPKEIPVQFNIRVSPAGYVPRASGHGQSPHVKY